MTWQRGVTGASEPPKLAGPGSNPGAVAIWAVRADGPLTGRKPVLPQGAFGFESLAAHQLVGAGVFDN